MAGVVVRVQVTLDVTMEEIAADRLAFEDSFKASAASALGVLQSAITITSIAAGSVLVTFTVTGVEQDLVVSALSSSSLGGYATSDMFTSTQLGDSTAGLSYSLLVSTVTNDGVASTARDSVFGVFYPKNTADVYLIVGGEATADVGGYALETPITRSGVYDLRVTVSGEDVSGSPFEVRILPDVMHVPSCTAHSPGCDEFPSECSGRPCIVGEQCEGIVTFRDVYGNARTMDPSVEFSTSISVNWSPDGTFMSDNELRKAGADHQIEEVGKRLRSMMPWISAGKQKVSDASGG